MKEVIIATGVRTSIGNFGGTLKDVPAHKLGERVVREVVIGCVGQSNDAYNVACVISLPAGLPIHIPADSVQRNGPSGLQPFVNAYQNIQSKDVDV